jgi:hypothetical protein
VNALEVLAAFPGDSGLREFRDWARTLGNDPRPPTQRTTFSDDEDEDDVRSTLASPSRPGILPNVFLNEVFCCEMQEARLRQLQAEFKYKHRNQKKNYIFEDEFPRPSVTREYLHPQVDRSPAPFSWSGLQYAAHVLPAI